MDVDLSERLRVRKKSGGEASSSASSSAPAPRRRPPVKYGSIPPTRVEQRSWERGGKYGKKVVATAPTNEVDQVRPATCWADRAWPAAPAGPSKPSCLPTGPGLSAREGSQAGGRQ